MHLRRPRLPGKRGLRLGFARASAGTSTVRKQCLGRPGCARIPPCLAVRAYSSSCHNGLGSSMASANLLIIPFSISITMGSDCMPMHDLSSSVTTRSAKNSLLNSLYQTTSNGGRRQAESTSISALVSRFWQGFSSRSPQLVHLLHGRQAEQQLFESGLPLKSHSDLLVIPGGETAYHNPFAKGGVVYVVPCLKRCLWR